MRASSLLALAGALGHAAARPGYAGAPLAVNLTGGQQMYLTELDPSVIVTSDWDAITISWEAYGVPWNSFISNAPLPAWWEDRLNRTLEYVAAAKLPVILQLSHGGGNKRSCPAQNATETGVQDVLVCGSCFDYNVVTNPLASFFRQGYANFALFMAARFSPVAMGIAMDLNAVPQGGEECAAHWEDTVDFVNQVYDTLKNFAPQLSVYPVLSHEAVMGVQDGQPCAGQGGKTATPPASIAACVNDGLALVSGLKRDAFAVSMYPSVTQLSSGAWQLWYASVVFDALDAKDAAVIAIASWGYDSAPLAVNYANGTIAAAPAPRATAGLPAPAAAPVCPAVTAAEAADAAAATAAGGSRLRAGSGASPSPTPQCVTVATSTTTDAADFLGYLVDLTGRYSMAFVSFYSAGDVFPADVVSSCPCKSSSADGKALCTFLSLYRQVCALNGLPGWACEATLKITAVQGARDYTGKPKPDVYAALQAARAAGGELHPLLLASAAA